LLGIVLDGRSISEASVGPEFKAAGIAGGSASITGRFTADEARDLEVQLRGGSLPLPVKVIEVRSIGPSLGAENVRTSLLAALSGLALVAVFMVVMYRLPGMVSVLALALYSLFNLGIYALIPVTLSLPGIAGFILSIGMAVDANVLIYERIREELNANKPLRAATAKPSRVATVARAKAKATVRLLSSTQGSPRIFRRLLSLTIHTVAAVAHTSRSRVMNAAAGLAFASWMNNPTSKAAPCNRMKSRFASQGRIAPTAARAR
jgi:protein-export membrane protein SecD